MLILGDENVFKINFIFSSKGILLLTMVFTLWQKKGKIHKYLKSMVSIIWF